LSAVGDLAGYAGGGKVVAVANKVVNANPGAITAAATRLSTAATNAGTDGGEVAKAVTNLDAAWEGSSADQFVAYMGRFAKAGTDIGTSMTQAADALTKVAEAITSAQSYVSTRSDQALTEIRNWIRRNPDATQEQLDSFTEGVCGEAATDIGKQLDGTEATLASAATALKSAATPASTFSAMPDPNTQPFTPQPGVSIQWTPTPPKTSTAPASADTTTGQNTTPPPQTGSGSQGGSGSGGGGGSAFHGGGGGGGLGPSGGPPAGGPPPGNVQEWIKEAIEILRANGINVSDADAQYIWEIIQHESGGNPHAINNWDSNAAAGHPSKGLMQTIDSTFNSHALPGHNDIWNPVDNIIAGVRYSIGRYGSLANVPGVRAIHSGGSYVGY
jgi:WXG100 family type VII secretion target